MQTTIRVAPYSAIKPKENNITIVACLKFQLQILQKTNLFQ